MTDHRKLSQLLCNTVVAALLFAGTASTATAYDEDPALSARVDALEDVVRRIEFDGKRMQGVDYLDGWGRVVNMNLCGALAFTMSQEGAVTADIGLDGGLEFDPTFLEAQEYALLFKSSTSGKVGYGMFANARTAACVDVSPWLLAFFYKEIHGQLPPLEAFTYEEYLDAVAAQSQPAGATEFTAPAARTKSASLDDAAIDNGGELSGLNANASEFLTTATELVFGTRAQAYTRFEELPIHTGLIGPVDSFFDAIGEQVFPRIEDGALTTLNVAGDAVDDLENVFLQSGNLLESAGDSMGAFMGMASVVQDILPLGIDFGALEGGIRSLSLQDMNPCAIADSQGDTLAGAILPAFMKEGIEQTCNGVSDIAALTLNEFENFETALLAVPDAMGFVDDATDAIDTVWQKHDQMTDLNQVLNHETFGQLSGGVLSTGDVLVGRIQDFLDKAKDMFDFLEGYFSSIL